jgi:hypothetical protein
MNALEATIRDAMEDMGLMDPDESIVQHIASQVDGYLIYEGWTRPPRSSEEFVQQRKLRDERGREPPPGTSEAEGDGPVFGAFEAGDV